jgi:hypothetical protein
MPSDVTRKNNPGVQALSLGQKHASLRTRRTWTEYRLEGAGASPKVLSPALIEKIKREFVRMGADDKPIHVRRFVAKMCSTYPELLA